MTSVGFIGTGEIAAAMVRGLAGRGHRILVSERGAAYAAALAAEIPEVEIARNADLVARAEVVVLCLPQAAAAEALPPLPFRAEQTLVSVMLGVSRAELAALCAPATEIAITIPLPFIATGGCPLPVYPASPALEALFGDRNPVIPLPSEAALAPHFAATALCSVTLAQMQTVRDWLGDLTGDAPAAERYVTAMLGGTLAGLPQDGRARLEAALAALAIEGGLNATLKAHMEHAGALAALREGLDAFRPRLGLPPQE